MVVTEPERKILLHTLAWPDCYRNYFAAGVKDEATCESLVEKGLMFVGNKPTKTCPYFIYHVSQKGWNFLDLLYPRGK